MTLTRSARGLLFLIGIACLITLALPEVIRARWLCSTSGGDSGYDYSCRSGGLPSWSNFVWLFATAPFYLLYLSSRLRGAVTLGSPVRSPLTSSWVAGAGLTLLTLIASLASWPNWTLARAWIDCASFVVWLTLCGYFALLSCIRTAGDDPANRAMRAFPHLGLPLLLSGLILYAVIFAAELLHMIAASSLCRPHSVCDGPATVFMVIVVVVWGPGWLVFLPFLSTAADRAGVKPWRTPEPRLGAILIGLLLMGWAIFVSTSAGPSYAAGAFYIGFGLWFFAIQHLCGRAARRSTLEIVRANS